MIKGKENIPNIISSSKELEEQLLEKNPQIFDGLSDNKKEEIINSLKEILYVEVKQEITKIKRSPVPFPEDLKGYYEIDKKYADIILKMSQDDQKYSHSRDNKIIEGYYKMEKRGQIFALIVSIVAIAGGVICISLGYQVAGTIVGGFGLLGIVSKFLDRKPQKELE